jgi:CheY-like chemotaxis protein
MIHRFAERRWSDGKEANKMDEFYSKQDMKGVDEVILIAEDDAAIRELMVNVLEDAGYSVVAAANGLEAIEVFKKSKESICLVILDKIMPKMNGDETFRALKKIGLDVPLLLSSGYHNEEKEMVDEGVTGFIRKPYRIDELVEKVRSTLENRKKVK